MLGREGSRRGDAWDRGGRGEEPSRAMSCLKSGGHRIGGELGGRSGRGGKERQEQRRPRAGRSDGNEMVVRQVEVEEEKEQKEERATQLPSNGSAAHLPRISAVLENRERASGEVANSAGGRNTRLKRYPTSGQSGRSVAKEAE